MMDVCTYRYNGAEHDYQIPVLLQLTPRRDYIIFMYILWATQSIIQFTTILYKSIICIVTICYQK